MLNFYECYNKGVLDYHREYSYLIIEFNRSTRVTHYIHDFDPILHIIVRDAYCAYVYAKELLQARWPLGELSIMKNPRIAYYYAWFVIKGRFVEAERYIMKDVKWHWAYMRDIMTLNTKLP